MGTKTKGNRYLSNTARCVTNRRVKGDGPVGMSLKPPHANFANKKVKNKPDSELLKAVRKGRAGTAMPAWENDLSEQQTNDVIAHVRTLSN